jgi:hypothetical protein
MEVRISESSYLLLLISYFGPPALPPSILI